MKSNHSEPFAVFVAVCSLLLLTACQSGFNDSVSLNDMDQAAAEQQLYPQFDLAHAAPLELDLELRQKLNEIMIRLNPEPENASDRLSLVVTAEPDADAGCIAGGRLFVSKGLLAWIKNSDEMAGAIAIAMHQCPRASRFWREREAQELVAFDERSELMNRYIDYRLNSNASLFNQAVAGGCGNNGCGEAAREWLIESGFNAQGLSSLAARIQQAWPQSAWLERTGLQTQDSQPDSPDLEADPEWARLLKEHDANREGYAYFADVRRQISQGRLHRAYQASLKAMRALGRTYEVDLMQAELDLHNLHPYYSERIFRRIEDEHGKIIHREYYWGWAHAQLKRRDQAIDQLTRSIAILPKVSAHHFLGQQYILTREHELAFQHLNHVLEAGPRHPYASEAEMFLDIVERSRQ